MRHTGQCVCTIEAIKIDQCAVLENRGRKINSH